MASFGNLSIHIQSIIADSLTNISSVHSNANFPSHHVRKEGWTERYGNKDLQAKQKKLEKDTTETNHDASNIQLIQYRCDWSTQLLLRIQQIPHTLVNTGYVSNHSTGAFPQFKDLKNQIVVGNQDILSHLFEKYYKSENTSEEILISNLLDKQNYILKAMRYGDEVAWETVYKPQCIRASILHKDYGEMDLLDFYLEQVKEEELYIKGNWSMLAWFQSYAERVVHLKQIKLGRWGMSGCGITATLSHKPLFSTEKKNKTENDENATSTHNKCDFNLDHAVALSQEGYHVLDSILAKNNSTSNMPMTLLGTKELGMVDILLFGHLAEALCDIHLVTILAEYKNLILFFQRTYQQYFSKEYLQQVVLNDKHSSDAMADNDTVKTKHAWIRRNDLINAMNQFNQLPMNYHCGSRLFKNRVSHGEGYQDAIKIMQQVALHCHDLKEVLKDMSLQREKEANIYGKQNGVSPKGVGHMLRKVLMGGDLKADAKDEMKISDEDSDDDDDEQDDMMKKNRQYMKKMLKEAKKNDELWISGVIGATIIGLMATSGGQ